MPLIKEEMGKVNPLREDKAIRRNYLLTAETKFDAAHRLSDCGGKHQRIHGHAYRVVIIVKSEKSNQWVVNSRYLKKLLKNHVNKRYDHRLILKYNDDQNGVIAQVIPYKWVIWMNNNPTAENIAHDIYEDIALTLKTKANGIRLVSVTVYETPTNAAIYSETPIKMKKRK